MRKKDEVTDALLKLSGEMPTPRLHLSVEEKRKLIAKVGGPRTVKSIIKAKSQMQIARIPFVFSTLDTQAVIDILNNDMDDVL
jgi:hypothetical protein